MQFNKASKAVAKQLFVSFYRPPVTVGSTGSAIQKLVSLTDGDDEKAADEVAGTTLSDQAQRWAAHIEDEEFSLAELQGEQPMKNLLLSARSLIPLTFP